MESPNYDILTQLSGNALAIATFIFFIRYFITKEDKREKEFEQRQAERDAFFGAILKDNTQALRELKLVIDRARPCSAFAPTKNGGEV